MNRNEKCLIKYLSSQGGENPTHTLVRFLLNHDVKFIFKDLNPVYNIIDEIDFYDNFVDN